MKLKLTTLLLFFTCATSFAQYDSKYLIPYKSGGVSGWSDTLGNIIIEPNFRGNLSFFEFNQILNKRLSFSDLFSGEFRAIKEDGSFLFPEEYFMNKKPCEISSFYEITNSSRQKGIYSLKDKEVIVPVGQNEIYILGDLDNSYAFFKSEPEQNFNKVSSNSKIEKTDIKTIIPKGNEPCYGHLLFVDSKKGFGRFSDGEVHPLSEEQFNEGKSGYYGGGSILMEVAPPMAVMEGSSFFRNDEKSTFLQMLKDRDFELMKEEVFGWGNNLTFYATAKHDGKFGIISHKAEIIVPFEFDSIRFNGEYAELKKEGKMGYFIHESKYPYIDAKYNYISPAKKIVYDNNLNQYFEVFKARDQRGEFLVGVNGVEFLAH